MTVALAEQYGRHGICVNAINPGPVATERWDQESAIRAVAVLPGLVGAYDKLGGGALLRTAASFGIDSSALRRPSGRRGPVWSTTRASARPGAGRSTCSSRIDSATSEKG